MNRTRFKPAQPYSLHDSHLIAMEAEGDALTLRFQYGFTRLEPTCDQVDGYMEITGVLWKECCAYLLEYHGVLCGNYGNFTGRKLTLAEFIEECQPMGLSVMEDSHSNIRVILSGFHTAGNKCYEFMVEICFVGEINYFIEE